MDSHWIDFLLPRDWKEVAPRGIEPLFPAWEASVLAARRWGHNQLQFFWELIRQLSHRSPAFTIPKSSPFLAMILFRKQQEMRHNSWLKLKEVKVIIKKNHIMIIVNL